jgi:hypothetical protein
VKEFVDGRFPALVLQTNVWQVPCSLLRTWLPPGVLARLAWVRAIDNNGSSFHGEIDVV